MDGTDYWDVTETYVTVEKEGKSYCSRKNTNIKGVL